MSGPSSHAARALVVFESMFGNTERIARAVAETLELHGYAVTTYDVADAATPSGAIDTELVVVGAPTHAFSLSRPSTRADAVRQGADASKGRAGLREWLEAAAPASGRTIPTLAFDTRAEKVRHLPMAAGPRALRLAKHRGFDTPVRAAAFLVSDTAGPLLASEVDRARSWISSALSLVRPAATGAPGGGARP